MTLGVVVLAAGQGTRMRSTLPKVLHPIAGRPLVGWVLEATSAAEPAATVVVLGHGADDVAPHLPADAVVAIQTERRGTGDAARVGLDALDPACDTVLIACGDTPLLTADVVRSLVEAHAASGAGATMLSATLPDAGAYGRVLRGSDGRVERIVEARDATPQELEVQEFNAGLYVCDVDALRQGLAGLDTGNAQGELYLTDAVGAAPGGLAAVVAPDAEVAAGVNDRLDLAACEAAVQARLRRDLMLSGVTMPDPGAVYLDADVVVEPDAVLWPGTHLRGATRVGAGASIGPDVVAAGSTIGAGAQVRSAHLVDAVVGDDCQVGPFAYLRPGTRLERGSRAGTYVELKNTVLGAGAKVPHLSYVGDADVGEGTNIGAGNITANYDGFRKHRTEIGARVRTGSDCVFVAPVRVGDDAMTGAGSIITQDVPDGALGIARARQSVIEGFTEKAAARARAAAQTEKPEGASA